MHITVHGTHMTDKSDEKVGKVWLLFMNSSLYLLLQLTKKKEKKEKENATQNADVKLIAIQTFTECLCTRTISQEIL